MPMNIRPLLVSVASALILAAASGCSKEEVVPELTANEVVSGAPEAFKGASAEVQKLAADAAAAISNQDYPTAWEHLQALNSNANLTDAQKEFVAASIAAVGAEMNKAEEAGNEAAEEALRFHRANK